MQKSNNSLIFDRSLKSAVRSLIICLIGIGGFTPAVQGLEWAEQLRSVFSSSNGSVTNLKLWNSAATGGHLSIDNYDAASGTIMAGDSVIRATVGNLLLAANAGKDLKFTGGDVANPVSMIIKSGGNIGIGTTTPQSLLSVNGTITAKEVQVLTTGWPDYVFEDGYQLRDLAEVEAHIKVEKHLPGVPSEREIVDQGLPMANMMAKHMEKIEELTLYAIQANKEIEACHRENDELRQRLEALEEQLSGK